MTMSDNLERLKRLLAELFQLDQADLDFGIYRIMNTKREEIIRFLVGKGVRSCNHAHRPVHLRHGQTIKD
jgi:adenine-specific DNA-methyltransferase